MEHNYSNFIVYTKKTFVKDNCGFKIANNVFNDIIINLVSMLSDLTQGKKISYIELMIR